VSLIAGIFNRHLNCKLQVPILEDEFVKLGGHCLGDQWFLEWVSLWPSFVEYSHLMQSGQFLGSNTALVNSCRHLAVDLPEEHLVKWRLSFEVSRCSHHHPFPFCDAAYDSMGPTTPLRSAIERQKRRSRQQYLLQQVLSLPLRAAFGMLRAVQQSPSVPDFPWLLCSPRYRRGNRLRHYPAFCIDS
jgi:hypothetical protein